MERSDGVSSRSCNSSKLEDRNASFSAAVGEDDTTEISIFEAQKYFNEPIIDNQKVGNVAAVRVLHQRNNSMGRPPARFSWDSSSAHNEHSSKEENIGYRGSMSIRNSNNYRARSFHAAATPTASSEASWNSQTGLLSHRHGTAAVSLSNPPAHHHLDHKKTTGTSVSSSPPFSSSPRIRWFRFPRRCPCTGKKSVRVDDDKMSSSKQQQQQPKNLAAAAARSTISLDIRNQTPKLQPVAVAAAARDDHQFTTWEEKQLRHREAQLAVNIPSAHNRLFKSLPELQVHHSTNAFSFPILKLNASSGTSWPSSSSMMKSQQQQHQRQPSIATIPQEWPTHLFAGKSTTTSPKSREAITSINDMDDVGSDASSDLFEIESFSTSTHQTTSSNYHHPSMSYHQYINNSNHRRDSMEDDAPSFNAIRSGLLYRRRSSLDIEPMTPSSSAEYCYEPSEASIDWSVTTAEGLDHQPSTSSEVDVVDELIRGWSYGLLSCRSEKAVNVGPNPVRLVVPAAAAGVCDQVTKHVGSRPPLPNRPRSSHLSISFAT